VQTGAQIISAAEAVDMASRGRHSLESICASPWPTRHMTAKVQLPDRPIGFALRTEYRREENMPLESSRHWLRSDRKWLFRFT
jgi:hypothetical protein